MLYCYIELLEKTKQEHECIHSNKVILNLKKNLHIKVGIYFWA